MENLEPVVSCDLLYLREVLAQRGLVGQMAICDHPQIAVACQIARRTGDKAPARAQIGNAGSGFLRQ